MTKQQHIENLERQLRFERERNEELAEKVSTGHILALPDFDKATRWTRRINDIHVEVVLWGEGGKYDPNGKWNFYIYIHDRQLSPEDFAKVWLPNETPDGRLPTYRGYGILEQAEGWNGGITFYEKSITDDARKVVKAGCDYGHLWDHENPPTIERVAFDARRTVESLCELLRFKRWCNATGAWDYPENMVEKDGKLYTPAGIEKMKEWHTSGSPASSER